MMDGLVCESVAIKDIGLCHGSIDLTRLKTDGTELALQPEDFTQGDVHQTFGLEIRAVMTLLLTFVVMLIVLMRLM